MYQDNVEYINAHNLKWTQGKSTFNMGVNEHCDMTHDEFKATSIAKQLESGSVCINDMTVTYGVIEAPFGGRKTSGVGQVNGDNGILGYCYQLPVIVDRWKGKNSRNFYPYGKKKDEGVQKAARFLFGTSLGRWLS